MRAIAKRLRDFVLAKNVVVMIVQESLSRRNSRGEGDDDIRCIAHGAEY